MKKFILILSIILTGKTCISQVDISFDFSNVEQTIAFFKKDEPGKADIDSLLATPGLRAIIKKIRSNDSIARVVLEKLSNGTRLTGKENYFQYVFIKEHLQELDDFVKLIKAKQQVILDSIRSLAVYLPAGKKMPVKVCFLVGGYSAGFTLSDDNVFYIGMHQYKNDFTGIVNTCQHELFHNIQGLSYSRTAMLKKLQKANENPAMYFYYLAQHLFVEGTAEYIADIDKMDQSSVYIKDHVAHAAVNDKRMAENFYLIEKILTDAYINTEKIDADLSYNILYDWGWNNVGYAVGKYMSKALVKAYGPQVMNKYLASDPMIFIRDYIKLAKTNKKDFPYNFSEVFEQITDSVVTKVDSL